MPSSAILKERQAKLFKEADFWGVKERRWMSNSVLSDFHRIRLFQISESSQVVVPSFH
jgi:hypothetical protein